MREIISISVPSNLKKKISRVSREYKLSQSELVKRAIDKYLISLDLEKLRKKLIPYAQKKKYFTDEDIFGDKKIS